MSGKGKVKPNNQVAPGPIGNTQGLIVPQTSPNASGPGNSAPPPKPTPKEESWWKRWGSEALHTTLDVVGMIPAVGEVADGANALVYLAEGDKVSAALSAAAMLPVGGQAATAAKWGKKGVQAVEKQVAKEAAERAAKEAAEKSSKKGSDGGKVTAKQMKEQQVKCFKKNSKGDPYEYDEQLRDQERGLNNLSVKEYLEGRAKYQEIGRHGTGAAQRRARAEYSKELVEKFKKQLNKKGVIGSAAQQQAEAMATDRMKTLAALHNPDMIAGGKDVVTSMGDKGVNSSIGSQWKGRVDELDKAAKEVPAHERGDTKMNVKLKRCK